MNKIKIEKLISELKKYFNSDIELKEVSGGRTNTNFFVEFGNKEYFLRTNIVKVQDAQFGGKLEKENQILKSLKGKGITADLVYYYNKDIDLQFILTEKIKGETPKKLLEAQDKIFKLLRDFQSIDHKEFCFLEKHSFDGIKNVLENRISKVNNLEWKNILSDLTNYLYNNKWEFKEDYSLCHNDFRSDNVIISNDSARVIDLEGMIIGDKYIDLAEYYVGGIFWDCFDDEKQYDYDKYKRFMDKYGFTNIEKQKYMFVMKFCSYFARVAAYLSNHDDSQRVYFTVIEKNVERYYKSVKSLLFI